MVSRLLRHSAGFAPASEVSSPDLLSSAIFYYIAAAFVKTALRRAGGWPGRPEWQLVGRPEWQLVGRRERPERQILAFPPNTLSPREFQDAKFSHICLSRDGKENEWNLPGKKSLFARQSCRRKRLGGALNRCNPSGFSFHVASCAIGEIFRV